MKYNSIPKHVAIIPDGNRRWAKARKLPTFEGHRRGFERVLEITRKARELGIKVLTIWAFSTENWEREKEEVGYLMKLYEQMVKKHLQEALENEVRIIHLGRKDRINGGLLKKIIKAEEETRHFNKYYLCIALDYGGRDEIARAEQKVQRSKFKVQSVNTTDFNNFLDTKDLPYPDVDIIIRTSGEKRSSGLLLWQSAYSEFFFENKYFPDFTAIDFEAAIGEYQKRSRRFGK